MSARWTRTLGCLALAAALVAALPGCRPPTVVGQPVDLRRGPADPPRRPGRPLLLIAMPDQPSFLVVRRSLVDELQDAFDISTFLVAPQSTPGDLLGRIEQERPRALVVMDNPVLGLYRSAAARAGSARPIPPAVVVMTSFLQELPPTPGVTGVAYEVPGVTAFVKLRSIIKAPVSRVALLHRPGFRELVRRQTELAAKEQVALVPVEIRRDPSPAEIRTVLRQIRRSSDIDALWILNDNGLLRDSEFRAAAWIAELERFRIPVIVGLPNLVTGQDHFGDFAVVPDHEALGVQAAQLVSKVAASGFRAEGFPIEPPISTLTLANLKRLAALVGLRPRAAELVDREVQ